LSEKYNSLAKRNLILGETQKRKQLKKNVKRFEKNFYLMITALKNTKKNENRR
jgi:hypothetical protein